MKYRVQILKFALNNFFRGISIWISEIEERRKQKFEQSRQKAEEQELLNNPTLDDWLERRSKRRKVGDEARSKSEGGGSGKDTAEDIFVFSLPPALRGRPDLPPSLIPPSAECLLKAKDLEWG